MIIGEMLARGRAVRSLQRAPRAQSKRLHALRGHHWPRWRTGPGTQMQVAVSRFRPRTIPGPDIDRIVNPQDWYRMIPSTTYFLSLREL